MYSREVGASPRPERDRAARASARRKEAMVPAELDLATLQGGTSLPSQAFTLDRRSVAAYLAAVEDTTPIYGGEDPIVPPLALLALAMRGLAALIARHPGSLHVSQRLALHGPARVGEAVRAHLLVRARSERRGFAVLNLEVRVERANGAAAAPLLDGTIVLMVPLSPAASADGASSHG